jgi:hypothetical protein
MSLGGLRGTPTRIVITSEVGLWETPFNGTNWIVRISSVTGSNAEVNLSQYQGQNFLVRVWYPDGTSDQANSRFEPTDELDVGRFLQQSYVRPDNCFNQSGKAIGHCHVH